MKFLFLAAIACVLAFDCPAQTVIQHGEQVFAKTCATGYCHGPKGTSSGAPRLAGRGFTQHYIAGTVMRGIPGTGMPSFGSVLSKADLAAVVAYVATLNGVSNPETTADDADGAPSGPALTGDAARGQQFFFEATRSFGRCSTCHEVGGHGIPVAGPMVHVPASVAALKAIDTPNVKRGTLDGESMPVLVLSQGKNGTLFYDLTSAPPVERNALPGSLKITGGSTWSHSSFIGAYNDAELSAILAYLKATNRP